MAAANADKAVEQEQISFTSTAKTADFEAKCKGCILHATQDVHIAFDRPVQAGDFLLKANVMFDFPVEFTQISAIRDSVNGTLYILARR